MYIVVYTSEPKKKLNLSQNEFWSTQVEVKRTLNRAQPTETN